MWKLTPKEILERVGQEIHRRDCNERREQVKDSLPWDRLEAAFKVIHEIARNHNLHVEGLWNPNLRGGRERSELGYSSMGVYEYDIETGKRWRLDGFDVK